MADGGGAGLDRQVVRLPDGRQLIYYRFPSPPPQEPEPRAPEPRRVETERKRRKPRRKG